MPFRQFVQHNFWLKLFSLVLASLIWFVVHFDLQNTQNFGNDIFQDMAEVGITNVTVSVLASADDPRRFVIKPAAVEVLVKGRRAELRRVSASTVRVCVDLRGMKQPESYEPVIINLGAAGDVIALRADPPVVTVREMKY